MNTIPDLQTANWGILHGWERAAVVYALTGKSGPKSKNRYTIWPNGQMSSRELSRLGIAGLKDPTVIRSYRKAWVDGGGDLDIKPGSTYTLPISDFKDYFRSGKSTEVVYLIGSPDGGLVKIGTTVDLARRLNSLQLCSPVILEVLATVPGGYALESKLHTTFAGKRKHGEWFDLGDSPAEAFTAAI